MKSIPETFSIFKEPSLWMVLVGLAILLFVLTYVPFGGWIGLALQTGTFFHITVQSAHGKSELGSSDAVDLWSIIIEPLLLLLAAGAPLLASLYWAFDTMFYIPGMMGLSFGFWPKLAIYASLAFLPLGLTIAAISRSPLAVYDPRIWIGTIREAGWDYLATTLFYFGMWAAEIYLLYPAIGEFAYRVQIPFITMVVVFVLSFLPAVLRYRALGQMCYPIVEKEWRQVHEARPVAADENNTQRKEAASAPSFLEPKPSISEDGLRRLRSGALSDDEILELGRQALAEGNYRLVYRAVETLLSQHPKSSKRMEVLWVAALAQEANGEAAEMQKTLRYMLKLDPDHNLAQRAKERLS